MYVLWKIADSFCTDGVSHMTHFITWLYYMAKELSHDEKWCHCWFSYTLIWVFVAASLNV